MKRILVAAIAVVGACACGVTDSSPTTPQYTGIDAALGSEGGGNGNGQPKVDVCHLDDVGQYVLLTVAQPAVAGHRGHGDALPGEQVPEQQAKFLSDCQPVDVGPGIDVLGIGGGILASADGNASLSFPEGALSTWTVVAIEPAAIAPPQGSFGPVYEVQPEGIDFDADVVLTVEYSESDLPDGFPEQSIVLGAVVDGGWQEVAGSVVDADANSVSAALAHFSAYGLICGFAPGWVGCELEQAPPDPCIYTEPWESYPMCWNSNCARVFTAHWAGHVSAWIMAALKHPSEVSPGESAIVDQVRIDRVGDPSNPNWRFSVGGVFFGDFPASSLIEGPDAVELDFRPFLATTLRLCPGSN